MLSIYNMEIILVKLIYCYYITYSCQRLQKCSLYTAIFYLNAYMNFFVILLESQKSYQKERQVNFIVKQNILPSNALLEAGN